VRFIGLDVHLDFCEVAILERGAVRSAGRIATTPETLRLFAASLGRDDQVALEATGNPWAIASIIQPRVARVVVAAATDVHATSTRGAKTDRLDARAIARLLAADMLVQAWLPDEQTLALRRRLARRAQLVRQRTRAKNEIHAVLLRNLKGRCPLSDLFGSAGRAWLGSQDVPGEERDTIDGCLREIDFVDGELMPPSPSRP
jgi:transposase